MKIKPPSKIKIGSYVYKVKLEKDLIVMQGNIGEHRPHKLEIVVDECARSKTPALIHEVVHAICDNYCVKLDDADTDRLAHGFTELLDNLGIKIDWEWKYPKCD